MGGGTLHEDPYSPSEIDEVPDGQVARPGLTGLRSSLDLTQAEFARLVPVSVRTLATLEAGKPPTEAVSRRLVELQRLIEALRDVISDHVLADWLKTPNAAFGGLKPVEVIDRGEVDRLWEMIYRLRVGDPA